MNEILKKATVCESYKTLDRHFMCYTHITFFTIERSFPFHCPTYC
jgi:hypothetical protein